MSSFSSGTRGSASPSRGGGMTGNARASVHTQQASARNARGAAVNTHKAGAASAASKWSRSAAYRNGHR
jgi:hypothetical protein